MNILKLPLKVCHSIISDHVSTQDLALVLSAIAPVNLRVSEKIIQFSLFVAKKVNRAQLQHSNDQKHNFPACKKILKIVSIHGQV